LRADDWEVAKDLVLNLKAEWEETVAATKQGVTGR
jgi:hypothetical protein